MSTASTFAPVAPTANQYTDSWGGRKLRELDESAERAMTRVLSSEVITDNQRAAAWEKFRQATITQKVLWTSKLGRYVSDVLAGKRQPRPEVAPAVAEEVQQLELAAHTVQQQVEQQAQVGEEIMEEMGEVVAAALDSRGQQVPMWVATTNREELPAGLKWSGVRLPALAETVKVMRRGRARQVKVTGFFHAEGFLGIEVEFEGRAASVLRTSPRSQCFFGTDVHGLLAF